MDELTMLHKFLWYGFEQREGIFAYECTSHSYNMNFFEIVCILDDIVLNLFDSWISFQDFKLSLLKIIWDESATNL